MEVAHAQGRHNIQAFIELTRVSFEGLFFSSFFLSLPLPSGIDKSISILQKEKQ